jgi:hypothetical protein
MRWEMVKMVEMVSSVYARRERKRERDKWKMRSPGALLACRQIAFAVVAVVAAV